jgi:hypothetical protein
VLLPDEEIQALVYRPEIWTIRRGPFRRKRAPALALALTNYHLVITQEDTGAGSANYGLITRYCPRGRVTDATVTRTGDDIWLGVTLGQGGAEEALRVLFEPAAEPGLRELVAKLETTAH